MFASFSDSWDVLGASWGFLEASWDLGASRDCLEAVLGASWGVLGAPWGRLGPSWGRLGASWGRLGNVLGRLGRVLGRLGVSKEGRATLFCRRSGRNQDDCENSLGTWSCAPHLVQKKNMEFIVFSLVFQAFFVPR